MPNDNIYKLAFFFKLFNNERKIRKGKDITELIMSHLKKTL